MTVSTGKGSRDWKPPAQALPKTASERAYKARLRRKRGPVRPPSDNQRTLCVEHGWHHEVRIFALSSHLRDESAYFFVNIRKI